MNILYLLIPLSIVLVFIIAVIFWWALQHNQFDELEEQGQSIIDDDEG